MILIDEMQQKMSEPQCAKSAATASDQSIDHSLIAHLMIFTLHQVYPTRYMNQTDHHKESPNVTSRR